jgi:hypothetical protein
MVLVLTSEKLTGSPSAAITTFRSQYSQIRLTGHDFLSIGTGGTTTTNYPGEPTQAPAQGNETDETFPGRVFYVSTDQDGNFRVGEYFRIDQATGRATLNASAFDLAGLTSLKLGSIGAQLGETINEFSADATLSGNSNLAVPTEFAVKTYVDTANAAQSTATETLQNKTLLKSLFSGVNKEKVTVEAIAATGTIAYNVLSQQVLFRTTNASGNFVINIRGSLSETLSSLMDIGQSITIAFMNTNGGTAYYNTSIQIDGTTSGVTTRWQGEAPTSGNASSVDIYSYTVIKTGATTFSVFAGQTKFA